MEIKVRLLNSKGLNKFIELHQQIVNDFLPKKIARRGAAISEDHLIEIKSMVTDDSLTKSIEELDLYVDLDKKFSNKFELGRYLYEQLVPLPKELQKSKELWSWLTLVYIKELLVKKAGQYEIHSQYRYIFDYTNSKSWMRHTLHFSHYTYSKLKSDSIAFLWQPPFESGDFTNLAARPEILTNRNLAKFFYQYFFDKETKKYVAGFTGKGIGWNMRSFFSITLKELKMNFDTQECDLEQLFDLMPDGYKRISLKS